jgi:hypothetical protein
MAITAYTFSIQNAFPNHAVESSRLTLEVQQSAIVTALDHIGTAGDVCSVVFKDALSVGDEAVLGGLVAAHSGLPLPSNALDKVVIMRADGTAPPTAPDGRPDMRVTTAKRTTSFKLRTFCFYSAELVSGFHNVNPVTDAPYGDVTVKLYDAAGVEITTEADEVNAVKSVIDWTPTYDYEIIGGYVDLPSSIKDGITDQWYLSAIGVPHYPPQYFGSIDFINEVNLEAVTTQRVVSDGRAIQFMSYNYGGMPNTNTLRFILKYPAGVKKRFQIHVEHFV